MSPVETKGSETQYDKYISNEHSLTVNVTTVGARQCFHKHLNVGNSVNWGVVYQITPWADTPHSGQTPPNPRQTPWADTPGADATRADTPLGRRPLLRTVRILLECILPARNHNILSKLLISIFYLQPHK